METMGALDGGSNSQVLMLYHSNPEAGEIIYIRDKQTIPSML